MKNKIKIDYNKSYSISNIKYFYDESIFKIPKYQRGYVWKAEKVTKLIDSIIHGYPLGSIIIWNNLNNKYILDGQQRTRTLKLIKEKPFKFISEENFFSLIDVDFEEKDKIVIRNLLLSLRNKEIESLYINEENNIDSIQEELNKLLANKTISSEVSKRIKKGLDSYISMLRDGQKSKITSIEINGATEIEAVEIFDRLNSDGIPLTKMEKLSARWSNNILNIKNKELKEVISDIYKLDESEKIRDIEQNTPSELIWAFLISSFKETTFFKYLFTTEDKKTTNIRPQHIEKLLWIIRVLILNYHKKEIKNETLNDDLESDSKIGVELAEIFSNHKGEEYILSSIKKLNKTWLEMERLIPLLNIKTKSKYLFASSSISTNLFVSMAAQIFSSLSKIEKDEDINKFSANDNLQLIMVNEILKSSYTSSTNAVVKRTIINNSYLDKNITLEDVKEKLKEINTLQKKELDNRAGFENIAKLVISISYSEYNHNKIDKYDYDHIIPKKFLDKIQLSYGKNSIGNCGLLECEENKKKQAKFDIETLLSDRLTSFSDYDSSRYKELLNKFNDDKTKENLDLIMEFRFDYILERFIKNINPTNK